MTKESNAILEKQRMQMWGREGRGGRKGHSPLIRRGEERRKKEGKEEKEEESERKRRKQELLL